MDRSNSERRSSIVSELLLRAADSMPKANRHEPFARLLTTILQNVGSDIRVVLEMKEGEEGPAYETLSDAQRDREPDSDMVFHLKKPNSSTWHSVTNLLSSDSSFWSSVPYVPGKPEYFPVALASRNLRDGIRQALGAEAAEAAGEAERLLLEERHAVFEVEPESWSIELDEATVDSLNVFQRTAFPIDWLTRTNKAKKGASGPARSARALARLAASTNASRLHAGVHLKNSTRMYQALGALNAVTHGLLTLRDVTDVTDTEYFEALLLRSRKAPWRRFFIEVMGTEQEKGNDEERVGEEMVESNWMSRTTPLEKDDPEAEPRAALLREEMAAAEALARTERADGWKRVTNAKERATIQAFLDAADFLKNSPDETPRLLRDSIDTRRCREEIESAKRLHYAELLGAKQCEIAARVLSAVLRFPHPQSNPDISTPDPGRCTPAYVRETKCVNCFTGPWLAAAMLLECGFDEKNIFYCDVQGSSGNVSGTHGSLLLALDNGQQVLLDVAFHKMRNVSLGLYDNATRKRLARLINDERNNERRLRYSPVLARLPRDTAQRTSIHPRMAVMPMRQGFAWGTLLTTGMDSFEAGDVAGARHAFELAHAFHPASPDVLVGLARCSVAEGESETAAALLNDAIRRCPDHKMARYQRALLCIDAKQYGHAQAHLYQALDERTTSFGGQAFVEHAKKLSAMIGEIFDHEASMIILQSEDSEQCVRMQLQDNESVIDSLKSSITHKESTNGSRSEGNSKRTGPNEQEGSGTQG